MDVDRHDVVFNLIHFILNEGNMNGWIEWNINQIYIFYVNL